MSPALATPSAPWTSRCPLSQPHLPHRFCPDPQEGLSDKVTITLAVGGPLSGWCTEGDSQRPCSLASGAERTVISTNNHSVGGRGVGKGTAEGKMGVRHEGHQEGVSGP